MSALPRTLLAALALIAVDATAAGRRLELLFTGDNGGEIAPCG